MLTYADAHLAEECLQGIWLSLGLDAFFLRWVACQWQTQQQRDTLRIKDIVDVDAHSGQLFC